jgi:hypothetical protein
MATGRTGAEILKSLWFGKPKPVETQYFNPLEAKIGSHVRISNLVGFDDELLKVVEIWAWDRKINGNSHQLADYILDVETKRIVLRVMPKIVKGKPTEPELILLTQYWPEQPGPYPWAEESQYVLDGLMDTTGELVRFKGEPQEEIYFRELCNIKSDVAIISDTNHDGKVEPEEVQKDQYSLWTFRRMMTDEAGQEFEQHLHVQLSGVYDHDTKEIDGGDKSILILRGESVSSAKIMMY